MGRKKRVYFETEEIITKTKKGWVELETDFIQMYHTAWKSLIKLNRPVSRDFTLWILSRVDDDNRFNFNKECFDAFNEELSHELKGKTYSRQSVEDGLREMKRAGIIRSISRGIYQVNPAIFWTSEQSKRAETVNIIDQSEYTKEVLKLGTPVQKIEETDAQEIRKNADNPAIGLMEQIQKVNKRDLTKYPVTPEEAFPVISQDEIKARKDNTKEWMEKNIDEAVRIHEVEKKERVRNPLTGEMDTLIPDSELDQSTVLIKSTTGLKLHPENEIKEELTEEEIAEALQSYVGKMDEMTDDEIIKQYLHKQIEDDEKQTKKQIEDYNKENKENRFEI